MDIVYIVHAVLAYLDVNIDLVGGPNHLGEGEDELLVGADGDSVAVLVDPAQGKVGPPERAGEEGDQLLLNEELS